MIAIKSTNKYRITIYILNYRFKITIFIKASFVAHKICKLLRLKYMKKNGLIRRKVGCQKALEGIQIHYRRKRNYNEEI